MIDLPALQLQTVRQLVRLHLAGLPVYAFGSRTTGRARKFSDLDLMVKADTPVDWLQLESLREALEDSELPICVDVVDWNRCNQGFQTLVEPLLQPL